MLYILLLVALPLLALAFGLDSSWSNVLSGFRNQTVFSDKNKGYGAYKLRTGYTRNLGLALFIASTFSVVTTLSPKIIAFISGLTEEKVEAPTVVDIDLQDLQEEKEEEKIVEPEKELPKESAEALPPLEPKDEKVEEPQPLPDQTDTKENAIQNEKSEGEEDLGSVGDGDDKGVVPASEEKPLIIVEEQAGFPGGTEKLYKFIANNFQYPDVEREAGIEGTVYLTFVVEKDGRITDIQILKNVPGGPNLAKEAARVVAKMPPWTPAKNNGHVVRQQFNLPVKCRLN